MAGANSDKTFGGQSGGADGADRDGPDWASGLKKLYNSVVDEPLPDSFTNLLAQLDGQADTK